VAESLAAKPLVEELEGYLLEHWTELPTANRPPGGLSFLAQGTGVSKVVLFVFDDKARVPRLVVKLPRHPRRAQRLLAETDTVNRLRAELPAELAHALPGPIRVAYVGGQPVTIEPALHGQPIDGLIPSGRALSPGITDMLLGSAVRWLVDIQRHAPNVAPPLDTHAVYDHFVLPIEEARSQSHLSHAEHDVLCELADLARQSAPQLPLYVYHGDFRAGNLLLVDGQLTALDWEFSRPLAPPLLDWFSFAFRLYCQSVGLPDIDGSAPAYRAAFERVFLAHNWFSERVAEHTLECCRSLGVDVSAVPLLLGQFVVENINKFRAFLEERACDDYLYLLRNVPEASSTFRNQIRRQAYVELVELVGKRRPFVTKVSRPSDAPQEGPVPVGSH
jgi:hypothetical protein